MDAPLLIAFLCFFIILSVFILIKSIKYQDKTEKDNKYETYRNYVRTTRGIHYTVDSEEEMKILVEELKHKGFDVDDEIAIETFKEFGQGEYVYFEYYFNLFSMADPSLEVLVEAATENKEYMKNFYFLVEGIFNKK